MHFINKADWQFVEEPFLKLEKSLSYGRNQNSRAYIAVKAQLKKFDEDGQPIKTATLYDNYFTIVRNVEKGTFFIVNGKEDTARLLVTLDQHASYRGGCNLVTEHTTATILGKAHAGNALDEEISILALMDVGSSVVFHHTGRYSRGYTMWEWDGNNLTRKDFSDSEWEARNQMCQEETVEGEEL